MPSYEEVARLLVKNLLSPDDAATVVDPEERLADLAAKIRTTSSGAVVVADHDHIVGVVSAADIAEAVSEGRGPDSQAKEILAGKPAPIAVSETLPVERLPEWVGQYPKVIVTNSSGYPSSVVDRTTLADRIRRLAT